MLLYGQWYGEIQERLEAFGLTDAPRAGIDKMCAVARGGDELSAAVNTEPLTVFLVLGDLASEAKGRVEAFDHSAAVGREHAVLPPRGRGGTGRDGVPQLASSSSDGESEPQRWRTSAALRRALAGVCVRRRQVAASWSVGRRW